MSDTAEEIKYPDVVFSGRNGKECEAFVATIQEFAFSKGWDEDHRWLLRFAKTRLRGEALRWCARLDPAVKKDWDLFVQALFDQYPSIEGSKTDGNVTPVWSVTTFSPSPSTITLPANPELPPNSIKQSPLFGPVIYKDQPGHHHSYCSHFSSQHTYPIRQYDPSGTGQQIGLLRVVNEDGTGIPQYIWWDYPVEDEIRDRRIYGSSYSGPKRTTLNRHEALIVSFLPSSAPHQIGCLNSRRSLGNLAIYWDHRPNKTAAFTLHGLTNNHSITGQAGNKHGFVSKVWKLLSDGTLQVSLSSFTENDQGRYDETKFTTTEVHVDISGETVRFVKPGTVLEQDEPKGSHVHPFVRARIVFEPL